MDDWDYKYGCQWEILCRSSFPDLLLVVLYGYMSGNFLVRCFSKEKKKSTVSIQRKLGSASIEQHFPSQVIYIFIFACRESLVVLLPDDRQETRTDSSPLGEVTTPPCRIQYQYPAWAATANQMCRWRLSCPPRNFVSPRLAHAQTCTLGTL